MSKSIKLIIFTLLLAIALVATIILVFNFKLMKWGSITKKSNPVLNKCTDLKNIKLITVNFNSITITFDLSSGGFQVVGKRDNSGNFNPLKYGSVFKVKEGDNIYWGDGDHAFTYLTVKTVEGNNAELEIKDTFSFPGAGKKEAVLSCQIEKNYP